MIYNLINGGLNVLDAKAGIFLDSLQQEEVFSVKDHPEITSALMELENSGFLVHPSLDERANYQHVYTEKQRRKFQNNSHIGIILKGNSLVLIISSLLNLIC